MAQYVRPLADDDLGGVWSSPAATNMAVSPANDSSYTVSSGPGDFRVTLNTISAPLSGDHIAVIRTRKDGGGGSLTAEIWANYPHGPKLWSGDLSVNTDSWSVGQWTIPSATAATFGTYAGLKMRFRGNSGSLYVSFFEITTPNAAPPSPPAAPSNLVATPITSARIDLSWTDNSSNEDNFVLQRATGVGSTSWSTINSPAANVTSYSNTGLAAETFYRYRIRATNTGGDSAWSAIAETTSGDNTDPPGVTTLGDLVEGQSSVTLSWAPVNFASSYNIQRSTTSGSGFTTIGTSSTTSYIDEDITNESEATLYYVVEAANAFGTSADSNEKSVAAKWWTTSPITGVTWWKRGLTIPPSIQLGYSISEGSTYIPVGTILDWTVSGTAPDPTGWWGVLNKVYTDRAVLIEDEIPTRPRGFTEIATFATGAAAYLGGGPSCVFNNRLYYAAGGYTPSTDPVVIRSTNGTGDEAALVVPTSGGTPAIGILSMIAANGKIYFSTLDAGTTSANWTGRVFEWNPSEVSATLLGAQFTGGHAPYALAWHLNRLWCGTNRQATNVTGKIYFFRPGTDTTWTQDRDLTTDSLAGVSSMAEYLGELYVGTTAPASTFCKVLKRTTSGVYSTSLTLSGGTAAACNGVPVMRVFGDKLYAAFWNDDTTPVSQVRKLDGTWSTAFDEDITSIIALPTDGTTLFVVAGQPNETPAFYSSTDGSTWTDRSNRITQSSTASTLTPVAHFITR